MYSFYNDKKLFINVTSENRSQSNGTSSKNEKNIDEEDEEVLLKKAIEMSMENSEESNMQQHPELNVSDVRRKRLDFYEKIQKKKH